MDNTEEYNNKTLNKEPTFELSKTFTSNLDSYDLVNDLEFFDTIFNDNEEKPPPREKQENLSLQPLLNYKNEEELFEKELLDFFEEIQLEKLVSEASGETVYSNLKHKPSLNTRFVDDDEPFFKRDKVKIIESRSFNLKSQKPKMTKISHQADGKAPFSLLKRHELRQGANVKHHHALGSPKTSIFLESLGHDLLQFDKPHGCKRKLASNQLEEVEVKRKKYSENIRVTQKEFTRKKKLRELKKF